MNRDAAKKLVRDTLQESFDKRRFVLFLKDLLKCGSKNFDESKSFHAQGAYISEKFRDFVKVYERIGTCTTPNDEKVDLLIVHLAKGSSIERARTSLRNFIADHLKNRDEKDAALAAFVAPDNKDWRFSFVKMEYKLDEQNKVREEFTSAHRYSFLVGKNENSHTAQSRLSDILVSDEPPSLDALEHAFSIEPVTREFFERYRGLFVTVKDALDNIVEGDSNIKTNFANKQIETADFAKKLLGQIVFLYFLQKKGWFGVARGKEWGEGDKEFLRNLFEAAKKEGKNYFNDYLEPLFYEALRQRRSNDDYYSRFDCKIPFLNGGLFDPMNDYDWVNTEIMLPNEIFSNDNRTETGDEGDGILDIFDRYNFTVKEDEPLEKEVAVDPEMLGKVFERLLEVRDRKTKGAYYTPREIVHYMCQESLTNYLATELAGDVSKESIAALVRYGEAAQEYNTVREQKIAEDKSYRGSYKAAKLPQEVADHAQQIDESIATIRVCDPAVGSGAFPVGMMNEIVRIRNALTPYLPASAERSPYHFKWQAIQDCLYGADIDAGAVEIAKLRLWLSLIVDEDDRKDIRPLPNLDYKIVRGNSLLGIKREVLNDRFYRELEELKPLHYKETDAERKQEIKEQIDSVIDRITEGRREFDFKLYFSEVFREKDGFDIIIGNPPYVRADSGDKHLALREKIKESGIYQTLYEKWDLMIPFIERGLKTAHRRGELIYIVSNSVCTSKYAHKLLDWIQEEYLTHSINYFEDMQVFDAGVIPVVLHFGAMEDGAVSKKIIRREKFENIVSEREIPATEFNAMGRDGFRKKYMPIVLHGDIVSLGDICYLSIGMVVNADEKQAKGKFVKDDLISAEKTERHSRPYVEGKGIDTYTVKKRQFLEWGTKRVPGQLRRQTFPELYDNPKIMRGRVTGGIYDDTGLLCNDSIVVFVRFIDLCGVSNKSIQSSVKKHNRSERYELEKISERFDLKYILAILNSSFAMRYLNNIRRHRLENYFYPDDFRRLPIADIPPAKQKPFIDLVDKIIAITGDNDYPKNTAKRERVSGYRENIEQLVNELYGIAESKD